MQLGLNAKSDIYRVPNDKVTELEFFIASKFTLKCEAMLIHQYPYVADSQDVYDTPVYEIQGVRGRQLQVFEEKCVIKTKVTVGAVIPKEDGFSRLLTQAQNDKNERIP